MTGLTFDDLVEVTGMTPRHLRFLMAEAFLPPPLEDQTFNHSHVSTAARYGQLRRLGFPPAAIRALLGAGEGIPVPIIPGLTLVIAPKLLRGRDDAAVIAAKAASMIAELLSRDDTRDGHDAG